jgi:large subunit ribosomal protein L16
LVLLFSKIILMFVPQFKFFKKSKKLKSKGFEFKTISLNYGAFGLKSLGNARVSIKNIETARQAITRKIKPFGKLWIRDLVYVPISSKPEKVRMGKGKGNVSYWACKVKQGQILFEISGIRLKKAIEALRLGGLKLPFKTKVIKY